MMKKAMIVVGSLALAAGAAPLTAQDSLITVELSYARAMPGRPKPNFSPKGTQVTLTDAAANLRLPPGATRPARTGVLRIGQDSSAWMAVLVTASSQHPEDLHQLWLDRNRNGNFLDDGNPLTATPTQNEKTRAWWSSLDETEITLSYPGAVDPERLALNFWLVRDDSLPPPDVLRYSVKSWRQGSFTWQGLRGLAAVMDNGNDAVFDSSDSWSVLGAAEKDAERAVLSLQESRPTSRFMFLPGPERELVLEFRSITPDGRRLSFAITDKMLTKSADRAPDDQLREERPRPRATVPFAWEHGSVGLEAALTKARSSGHMILVDFETTWCGPCQTMDQWIWTDQEVAQRLNAGYIGVKLDGDIEKALVQKYEVKGYPTIIILDGNGQILKKVSDYLGSRQVLEFLGRD